MLFLVDGYNVTKGDPATRSLSLEGQRDALLTRLRVRGSQLLGPGRVVVVFDGEAGMVHAGSAHSSSYPVEGAYSSGVSADDVIVSFAARNAGSKVCIVSSDRALAERASAQTGSHVDVRPRESLYEGSAGRPRQKGRGGVSREAGLPSGSNKITEEMKRIWLNGEE